MICPVSTSDGSGGLSLSTVGCLSYWIAVGQRCSLGTLSPFVGIERTHTRSEARVWHPAERKSRPQTDADASHADRHRNQPLGTLPAATKLLRGTASVGSDSERPEVVLHFQKALARSSGWQRSHCVCLRAQRLRLSALLLFGAAGCRPRPDGSVLSVPSASAACRRAVAACARQVPDRARGRRWLL